MPFILLKCGFHNNTLTITLEYSFFVPCLDPIVKPVISQIASLGEYKILTISYSDLLS